MATTIHRMRMRPPWPGVPFHFFCPDSFHDCQLLNNSRAAVKADCFEPEEETLDTLVSLLLHCDVTNCTYVDVGCNMGIFASYAAALGASVECFEPSPVFRESLEMTAREHGTRFAFHAAAVYADAHVHGEHVDDRRGYLPCGVGRAVPGVHAAPKTPIAVSLHGREPWLFGLPMRRWKTYASLEDL